MKTQIERTDFGERLRKIRREKGITQSQLSEISGLSRRMIVHYETYIKMPPLSKVKKIAEALGVSSDLLIGIKEPSKEQIKKEEISHKIIKRAKVIEQLPLRDQRAIFNFINTIVEKNKLRKQLKSRNEQKE